VPFIQSLHVNGAVRYTSYRTSGDYTTWKIGLDWHVDDSLSFRATQSRDIRAPTLSELYQPRTIGRQTSQDFLTGFSPTVPLYGGGNPNLTAEIGHTTTAGLVWKAPWVSGLSVALDGYHIVIDNALSSIMGTVLAAQQVCYNSGGASPYCKLQDRPLGNYTNTSPANTVSAWYSENLNIANVETYGADLEINYATRVLDRPFTTRLMVNYQPHLYFNTPGLTNLDHAGVAYSTNSLYPAPIWSATAIFHYLVTPDFSVDLMERWRSSMTMKDNGSSVWLNPIVPSFYTTNLNLAYTLHQAGGQYQVFLNIQNLFNAAPPPAAFYSAQTQPGQFGGFAIGDDPVGRYYTLGVRIRY
jgi:outer membrane receptor protein involved in Fe transport